MMKEGSSAARGDLRGSYIPMRLVLAQETAITSELVRATLSMLVLEGMRDLIHMV